MADLLSRQNWRLRTVRTVRKGQNGLIRYPFQAPLISVETTSRSAPEHWVRAGFLDIVVRVSSSYETIQTSFIRLYDTQWIWIPEGITTYALNMRLRPWIQDLSLSVKEFTGDTSTDE
ncbi:MAG: hypothetical protein AAGD25_40575, partial [Cyanobacteria bacterium P01_F01_bin.150]